MHFHRIGTHVLGEVASLSENSKWSSAMLQTKSYTKEKLTKPADQTAAFGGFTIVCTRHS